MSFFSRIAYDDSSNIDAFGHLRVSNPEALVAIQCGYDLEPLLMEGGNTGTGIAPVYDAVTRLARLRVNIGTGVSFFQSYTYWVYQPGRSQQIEMTGLFGTPVANAIVDVGYFDGANGIFYRQNGTNGVQMVVRSSTSGVPVNQAVNQANWNIDKFDGLGPSGLVLDTTTVFILALDFQFLGMGRVRIGFDIGGIIYYAHEFLHANIITVPYMQTASLPIAMLITGTAILAQSNAFLKGATVISEGGLLKGLGLSFSTPDVTAIAATTRTHFLSIRPKLLFNGLQNRIFYFFKELNIMVTGGNPIYWELVAGAAFSVNPTYADVNTIFSGAEVGTGGTFLNLTNGVVLASGYSQAAAASKGVVTEQLDLSHPISLNRAGASIAIGTLSLLITAFTGTSAVRTALNYSELR